jgi:hypothetical protein
MPSETIRIIEINFRRGLARPVCRLVLAFVFAGVMLVAPAATWAACAWLLWGRFLFVEPQVKSSRSWEHMAAYDTYEKCVTAVLAKSQRAEGPGVKDSSVEQPAPDRRTVRTFYKDGHWSQVDYGCYPETVRPETLDPNK